MYLQSIQMKTICTINSNENNMYNKFIIIVYNQFVAKYPSRHVESADFKKSSTDMFTFSSSSATTSLPMPCSSMA